MKYSVRINLVVFILLFIASGCAAPDKSGSFSDSWHKKVAGTYNGVMSGGYGDSEVTTVLKTSGDGEITGSYSYSEGATTSEGKIGGCKIKSILRLACRWKNSSAEGSVFFTFNSDVTGFGAKWGQKGAELSNNWTGKK